jgi:hypothetical protein
VHAILIKIKGTRAPARTLVLAEPFGGDSNEKDKDSGDAGNGRGGSVRRGQQH